MGTPTLETALESVTAASRMLAEATTVDAVLDLRDRAAAIDHYLKKCRAGLEAQNQAAELKVRCERKLGVMLAEEIEIGRPGKVSNRSTLSDRSISRDDSSRYQRIASIPDDEFEKHIQTVKASNKNELTTAGALKLWRTLNPPVPEDPVFSVQEEWKVIVLWLQARRDGWPEKFRPTFTTFVSRIVSEMECEQSKDSDGSHQDP